MMKTNLSVDNKSILISWDDNKLDNVITKLFTPWSKNCTSADFEITIKYENPQYILTTPESTLTCPDERVLISDLSYYITILAQKILSNHTQIHATCVDHRGNGALLVGSHGYGKTTLALTAISSGLKTLTDDISLISNDFNHVLGFPRPFKVSDYTWNMIPRIIPEDCPFFKADDDLTFIFFYLPLNCYYSEKTLLNLIIFPVRRPGPTKIRELGETEALRKILPEGFNFYLKKEDCVKDSLRLLRIAQPLEISYSDHWDVVNKIRDLLE